MTNPHYKTDYKEEEKAAKLYCGALITLSNDTSFKKCGLHINLYLVYGYT
jgi:hypothetical protein